MTFESAELVHAGQIQSIKRAFQILELMAESEDELTVSEIASRSGLAAATVHRMLQTLVVDGYVRQEASRAYALGPRLIHLGGTASRRLGSWARPFMARVAEATGETVSVAVLEADEVVYIAQIPSRHNLRMFTEIGRRLPPHCTAAGKALLGQRPDSDVLTALRRVKMTAFTPRTITDEDDFMQHLEFVRQQGYAVEDGEHEAGVRSLAVPVLGAPRNMAIAVSGPEARLSTTDAARLVPMMRDAVSELVTSLNPARDGSASDTTRP